MITPEQIQQVKDLIERARTIMVVVGKQPTSEQLATASGLSQAFRDSGKDVFFAGPEPLVAPPDFVSGLATYSTNVGNRNLVVSFPYDESSVENVSYHIGEESGKFFLTIKPQPGHKPLDASAVEYSYAGAEADLLFLVGVNSYDALGDLYVANERFFADTTTISLHSYETDLGLVKLDTSGESGLCSAAARLIREMRLMLGAEGATDLLAGIEQTTNNFKSLSTTADAFELAAWLMRQGARRVWRGEEALSVSPSANGTQASKAFAEVFSKKDPVPKKSKKQKKAEESELGGLDYHPSTMTSSR